MMPGWSLDTPPDSIFRQPTGLRAVAERMAVKGRVRKRTVGLDDEVLPILVQAGYNRVEAYHRAADDERHPREKGAPCTNLERSADLRTVVDLGSICLKLCQLGRELRRTGRKHDQSLDGRWTPFRGSLQAASP